MAAGAEDIAAALSRVMGEDHGRLIAALIRQLGDFQLAEDVLQDAMEAALLHWGRSGLPASPQGWLLKVARRKAIDRMRRTASLADKTREMAVLMAQDSEPEMPDIPDERLRLIFTCCHPALERKSQVALTLRSLGGLTTPEIARAFLDSDAAMGQRISRAKAKIAGAGIPFKVPGREDWGARLGAVLRVIYLIFNEGYSAAEGDAPIRAGLCEEAIWLARMLDQLRPGEAEIEGLLALMLFAHARRAARIGADGLPCAPEAQARAHWDRAMWCEAETVLDRAVARLRAGPFQIQAAISALHMDRERAPGQPPDWRQIMLLYDRLFEMTPSPVVALNRAVALAEVAGAEAGLAALVGLGEALARYQPYHAALADLLSRAGQRDAALAAYDRAIALSRNPADTALLRQRRGRFGQA